MKNDAVLKYSEMILYLLCLNILLQCFSLKTNFSSLNEGQIQSETRIIRSDLDLEQTLSDAIRKVRISGLDLELLPLPRDFQESSRKEGDFLLRTEADGVTRSFTVDCKTKPAAADVDRLGTALKDSSYPPLLATVNLSEPLVKHCERAGSSGLDLNRR